MARQNTLETRVRAIMTKYPSTRNDDVELTLMIWVVYYPSAVKDFQDGKYVRLSDIRRLPREDNVKRVRAKIQNVLHELVPTDPAVAKKRGMLMEEWRNYLGYENVDHL